MAPLKSRAAPACGLWVEVGQEAALQHGIEKAAQGAHAVGFVERVPLRLVQHLPGLGADQAHETGRPAQRRKKAARAASSARQGSLSAPPAAPAAAASSRCASATTARNEQTELVPEAVVEGALGHGQAVEHVVEVDAGVAPRREEPAATREAGAAASAEDGGGAATRTLAPTCSRSAAARCPRPSARRARCRRRPRPRRPAAAPCPTGCRPPPGSGRR
jgi:hypothetical protein